MTRAAALALVLLSSCSRGAASEVSPPAASTTPAAAAAPAPSASKVDGPRARELVAAGAKLVDVRSPEEYAEKHVDGAVNVPVDTVASSDLGPKDAPIVLYCHSGRRSAKAASTLAAKGYTRVYDLGAMSSW